MRHDLRVIPFFRDLSDDVLDAISRRLEREHYHKGATIFSQDEPGACMYLIETGQVKVVTSKEGREVTLAFLGPGNFFGETALLLGEKRSAGVQVVLDVDLLVLRKADFDELLLQHPVIAVTITRELSRRLGRSSSLPSADAHTGIAAVVGRAAPDLAHHLTMLTGEDVFLFDLGGLGNNPIDQAALAHNHVYLARGGDALDPEQLPGRLSALLEQYYWVLLSIPSQDSPLALKAMELADITAILGVQNRRSAPPHRPEYRAEENSLSLKKAARRIAHREVGLALSSGNARGMAHVGVLRVLEQEGVPIDMITGTSAGAVFGALYASGHSIEELMKFAVDIQHRYNFFTGFRYWDWQLPPRSGLLKGKVILNHFRKWLANKSFDDLLIPLYIVAADLISGEEIILGDGPVADAVRASMSVIGILEPARVDGRFLIDGGTVNPIPSQLLAKKGMHTIIASSVIPSLDDRLHRQELKKEGVLPNAVGILMGTMEIMESEIVKTRMGPVDVLIQPDVANYGTMEYDKVHEIIQRGEEATWQQIPSIHKLLVPHPRPVLRG